VESVRLLVLVPVTLRYRINACRDDHLVPGAVPADVTYGFPHTGNPESIARLIAKGEPGYLRQTPESTKLACVSSGQPYSGRGGI
jgi:hypothetical protein